MSDPVFPLPYIGTAIRVDERTDSELPAVEEVSLKLVAAGQYLNALPALLAFPARMRLPPTVIQFTIIEVVQQVIFRINAKVHTVPVLPHSDHCLVANFTTELTQNILGDGNQLFRSALCVRQYL